MLSSLDLASPKPHRNNCNQCDGCHIRESQCGMFCLYFHYFSNDALSILRFDPEFFYIFLLPPIIFEAGVRLSVSERLVRLRSKYQLIADSTSLLQCFPPCGKSTVTLQININQKNSRNVFAWPIIFYLKRPGRPNYVHFFRNSFPTFFCLWQRWLFS